MARLRSAAAAESCALGRGITLRSDVDPRSMDGSWFSSLRSFVGLRVRDSERIRLRSPTSRTAR